MKFQLIFLVALLTLSQGYFIKESNEIKLEEPTVEADFINTLNLRDGLDVSWEIYNDDKTIIFEVTSETTGWVGFGINPAGNMNNADLIMGGVNQDNTTYFTDLHSVSTGPPAEDTKQDWVLLNATEVDQVTTLRFMRLFDTSDSDDIAIELTDTKFIWSIGSDDDTTKQHTARGSVDVNILKEQPEIKGDLILSLDLEFTMSWEVYLYEETVIFALSCNTTGWIGFGLSAAGNMTKADLIMGGVYENQTSYFDDRFAEGHGMPSIDPHQDWELLDSSETGGITKLKFKRQLTTTDDQDINIDDENTYFIWSLGADDNTTKKHIQRGQVEVNILHPEILVTTTTLAPPPIEEADSIHHLNLKDGLDVKWSVYKKDKLVLFEVTSETTGWIGFGINPFGNMTGADLIMGGVLQDKSTYFNDCWSDGHGVPTIDPDQNWELVKGTETDGVTTLTFQRSWNTGDDKDIEINDKATKFIWSIGADDDTSKHHAERGSVDVANILSDESDAIEPDFVNTLNLRDGLDVSWEIYNDDKTIIFEVTSETTGWIGFGINPAGNMNNADLIMGGVNQDKTTYFTDLHSASVGPPAVDTKQDWVLLNATEVDQVTTLRFMRLFDTSDSDDIAIENKDTKFIWSLGSDDDTSKQHVFRGSVSVNILKEQPEVMRAVVLREGFTLSWEAYLHQETVIFDLSCNTTGWIGFGFSEAGTMDSADLIMGGVYENQTSYFDDRFAEGHGMPSIDPHQDWELLDSSETGGITKLKFKRQFKTADDRDLNIENKDTYFIWSLGADDDTTQQHKERGHLSVNILSPDLPGSTTEGPLPTSTLSPRPKEDPDSTHYLNLREGLDVKWDVYRKNKLVLFEVTSKTTGWIGFGINPAGTMTGADLIIGGVLSDRNTYFKDRWSDGHGEPAIDVSQDWNLVMGTETGGLTNLTFSRSWNTGDDKDIEINDKPTKFIWSIGADDDTSKQHVDQGSVVVANILAENVNDDATSSAISVTLITLMFLITKYLN